MLGVSKEVTEKELKTAYRKQARKFHPDVNPSPDAKEKFQQCTRAYEILSDPQKRRLYDQFGEAGVSSGEESARNKDRNTIPLAGRCIDTVEHRPAHCRTRWAFP